MSKEYKIRVPAHESIYSTDPLKREINVYFGEPDNGVNEDTGIVLFIPGFGGNANSNVYKKMRDEFADKYNLVTVQCDYFGQEFMQGAIRYKNATINLNYIKSVLNDKDFESIINNGCISLEALLKVAGKYNNTFLFKLEADLSDECLDNFNDMGIMQALDNIYAVLHVINILLENQLKFNAKKIIIYGHSHGAYLAHFCNILAPTLFNLIIDNSAWIYPVYINLNRCVSQQVGKNVLIDTSFEYYIKRNKFDKGIYFIEDFYKKHKNNCRILSFQGEEDILVIPKDKKDFCKSIDNCSYFEITKDNVDGKIFRSCKHGLDADFLEMFNYALKEFKVEFNRDEQIDLIDKLYLETDNYIYYIDYENVLPKLKVYQKN